MADNTFDERSDRRTVGFLEQFGLPVESQQELLARRAFERSMKTKAEREKLVEGGTWVEQPAIRAGIAAGDALREVFGQETDLLSDREKREFAITSGIRTRMEELFEDEEVRKLPAETRVNLFHSIAAQEAFDKGDPIMGAQMLEQLGKREREQKKARAEQRKLDLEVEELEDLSPIIRRKSEADTIIAEIQAQTAGRNIDLGGAPNELIKLQRQRDVKLRELEKNPSNKRVRQELDEINTAIDTSITNTQRVLEAEEPTTAVLTRLQTNVIALADMQTQLGELIRGFKATPESAGTIGDFRDRGAGIVEQVLEFSGVPSAITKTVGETVASDDLLTQRSKMRRLQAELTQWVRQTNRLSPEDTKVAQDLIQDMGVSSARRQVIALTELADFLSGVEQRNIEVILSQNVLSGSDRALGNREDAAPPANSTAGKTTLDLLMGR